MQEHTLNPNKSLSIEQDKDSKILHFFQGISLLTFPIGSKVFSLAAPRLGITLSELQFRFIVYKAMGGRKDA